jgi:tetratricopeptide (TPR) repeat protein
MRWDESVKPARALDFPSQMQILGVYEDEGYLLHELGRFREARQANERLLPVARERLKAMGKLQQIRGVLTNIAQNCYELGDLKQAGAYLQERLQIAQAAQDHATVYDSYFQLMVLAHEQKQEPQARQWLARYEQYALNQKDSQQQTRARSCWRNWNSAMQGVPASDRALLSVHFRFASNFKELKHEEKHQPDPLSGRAATCGRAHPRPVAPAAGSGGPRLQAHQLCREQR